MINRHKKQTLEDWIREALNDFDKEGKCTALSLVHVMGSAGGVHHDEIHTVKLGGGVFDPNALAALFRHKAESYAQELPGVQSFCLLAFYDNKPEPQAKHPFRVSGELDFDGLATEPPNETGQRGQNMRLTEAIVQGAYRQNSMTFDMIIRTLDVLTRQNADLINQNNDAFNMLKTVMLEQAQNNHEFRLKEMNREMIAKGIGYIPALANSVLGTEVFPQSTVDSSLIETLADSIETEDDLKRLASVIPPKIWPLLAGRLAEAIQKKEERKQEARRLEKKNGHSKVSEELD